MSNQFEISEIQIPPLNISALVAPYEDEDIQKILHANKTLRVLTTNATYKVKVTSLSQFLFLVSFLEAQKHSDESEWSERFNIAFIEEHSIQPVLRILTHIIDDDASQKGLLGEGSITGARKVSLFWPIKRSKNERPYSWFTWISKEDNQIKVEEVTDTGPRTLEQKEWLEFMDSFLLHDGKRRRWIGTRTIIQASISSASSKIITDFISSSKSIINSFLKHRLGRLPYITDRLFLLLPLEAYLKPSELGWEERPMIAECEHDAFIHQLIENTDEKHVTLIVGEGGMGKSTFLLWLCRHLLETYTPGSLLPIYMPCHLLSGHWAKSLVKYLTSSTLPYDPEYKMIPPKIRSSFINTASQKEILTFLEEQQDSLMLLIDGYNEGHDDSFMQNLGASFPRATKIVTTRRDTLSRLLRLNPGRTRLAELCHLGEEAVKKVIGQF